MIGGNFTRLTFHIRLANLAGISISRTVYAFLGETFHFDAEAKTKANLSVEDKYAIVCMLLACIEGESLPKDVMTETAVKFDCHRNTIYNVWNGRDSILHVKNVDHGVCIITSKLML